ncbi:hypothetical protein [Gemella morbillorum]
MRTLDITYGIPAEVWPRDYEHAENILMFWRKNNIPVRVTLEDGQVFCMYVQGTMPSRNKLDLCPIPYDKENMINKSYECKRALIKSINCSYDYKSDNNAIWKDYLTYTFYNFKIGTIPYLSFGISLKNDTRYQKLFYFLSYIAFFEEYLQEKIETLNNNYNLEYILYGGNE